MRLLDKIALNRFIITIGNLIIKILQLFAPKKVDNIDIKPKPKKRKILPWRN